MNDTRIPNRMEKHVLLAGVFQIAFGFIGIVIAVIAFVAIFGGGILSGDRQAMEITGVVATAVCSILLLFSIPSVIGGFGLLAYKRWARLLVLILSVIDLFAIPFGTILAVYTFWALLTDETDELFRKKTDPAPEVTSSEVAERILE